MPKNRKDGYESLRRTKNPGPSKIPYNGEKPGFGYPHRDSLYFKFIAELKFQKSNTKYQTNPNDRNSNIQTMSSLKVLVIEYLPC